jgi:hypothetical protein
MNDLKIFTLFLISLQTLSCKKNSECFPLTADKIEISRIIGNWSDTTKRAVYDYDAITGKIKDSIGYTQNLRLNFEKNQIFKGRYDLDSLFTKTPYSGNWTYDSSTNLLKLSSFVYLSKVKSLDSNRMILLEQIITSGFGKIVEYRERERIFFK